MLSPVVHAVALFALTAALVAEEVPVPIAPLGGRYAAVTVDPVKTSIYLGTVNLAMPPFSRRDGVYTTDYAAKVIPFFFYNERGSIAIEFSDDQLRQLQGGEVVYFKGHAQNTSGTPRRIEGRAVPDGSDPNYGKIKVRVWVSKRIQLIFNTVYRFSGRE